MEIAVAAVVAAVVLVALAWGVRVGRTVAPGAPAAPAVSLHEGRAVITLDVGDVDPASRAVGRLIDDASGRVLAAWPDAMIVEVRSRSGRALGTRSRETPREVDIPEALYEPHIRRDRSPDPREGLAGREEARPAVGRPDPDQAGAPQGSIARPLADRFDLPDGLRDEMGDADDIVELVQALLRAAGTPVERDGDVLRTADAAVIVVRAPIGELVAPEALSHAYRRFRESGAARGVVVTPGFMDPADVRRREVLVPALLHAGPDGIQRMADAVELGADPVRFAAAPALHA